MKEKDRAEEYRKEILELVGRLRNPRKLELIYIFVSRLCK